MMLERKQYNREMDQVRQKQIKEIADYLQDYIKINAEIRNQPVLSVPDQEVVDYVMNIPISREGRDPKEVGDELVEKVLSHTILVQHPKFLSLVSSAVSPYSLAGTILTDIYNPNVAGFDCAPIAGLIEEKLVKWMGSLAGFDTEKCGGLSPPAVPCPI